MIGIAFEQVSSPMSSIDWNLYDRLLKFKKFAHLKKKRCPKKIEADSSRCICSGCNRNVFVENLHFGSFNCITWICFNSIDLSCFYQRSILFFSVFLLFSHYYRRRHYHPRSRRKQLHDVQFCLFLLVRYTLFCTTLKYIHHHTLIRYLAIIFLCTWRCKRYHLRYCNCFITRRIYMITIQFQFIHFDTRLIIKTCPHLFTSSSGWCFGWYHKLMPSSIFPFDRHHNYTF